MVRVVVAAGAAVVHTDEGKRGDGVVGKVEPARKINGFASLGKGMLPKRDVVVVVVVASPILLKSHFGRTVGRTGAVRRGPNNCGADSGTKVSEVGGDGGAGRDGLFEVVVVVVVLVVEMVVVVVVAVVVVVTKILGFQ